MRSLIIRTASGLLAALSLPVLAGEPAWWTQQKANCGLPPSLDYSTWQQEGSPCNRGGATPAAGGGGDPAVRIGTALGNAMGDAIVQSARNAAIERQRRLDQMALENNIAQQKETDRLAEQARNDALRAQAANDHLRGVLRFSDPDADLPPPVSAHATGAAASGQSVQLNPGANTAEARALAVSPNSGAATVGTAREQLLNATGGRQTVGQTFDNGRAPGDGTVAAQVGPIATPLSARPALDPRLASSRDYQSAAASLAKAEAKADMLKKRQADLEGEQSTNPTPERQIQIYQLSGEIHEASGSVQLAQNNLATVKRTILGPAIIVDDDPPSSASNMAETAPSPAPATASH